MESYESALIEITSQEYTSGMDEVAQKINDFFTSHKHQFFKKNEILIRADDSPVGVYYLKEGFVREYAISKKGEEIVINIFKPNAFFPMSWAINQTPNSFFYEALSDVEVWRAPREEVVRFIKENPDVLFDLMSRVFKGTDGMVTRMTYLMAGNAYDRLITELLLYTKRFSKETTNVVIDISEKELAARSGMTRETVSREIKILKDNGIIQIENNKLVLQSIQKLEDELFEGF